MNTNKIERLKEEVQLQLPKVMDGLSKVAREYNVSEEANQSDSVSETIEIEIKVNIARRLANKNSLKLDTPNLPKEQLFEVPIASAEKIELGGIWYHPCYPGAGFDCVR